MRTQLSTFFCLLALGLSSAGVLGWSDSHTLNRHRAVRQHAEKRSTHHHQVNHIARGAGKKQHCSSKALVNVKAVDVSSTTTTTATSTTTTKHAAPTADTVTPGNNSTDTGSSGGGGSSSGGWQFSGDATYYGIGLGACGETSHEPDLIAAVSHAMFDSYATTEAAKNNPNKNPICGKMATAYLAGHGTVTVKIVDKCMGCDIMGSLDFSMAAFDKLTNFGQAVGRFHGMQWKWADESA